MSVFPAPARNDPQERLRRIATLRWVAIGAQFGLVLLTRSWPGGGAALAPVLAICLAQGALNLATITLAPRAGTPSDARLFAWLLLDMAALTGIAYFAGGATNPLISLYLLWIATGAAMLEGRWAAWLAAAGIGAYTLVGFIHAEVHVHDPQQALELHLVGMWVVFVFSAVTICWSVVRLTAAVRRRDAQLAAAREEGLRNERIVALGNLAAGAAHELGTPLTTMAVLAAEVRRDPGLPPALGEDLDLLRSQVGECRRIIGQLAAQAGSVRAEGAGPTPLDDWLERLIQRWRVQRPMVAPILCSEVPRPGPRVVIDATFDQALLNLFNNAADASPGAVSIDARWQAGELELQVLDRGPGIPEERLAGLGRESFSTRTEGLGMGLLLARAAIERSGGRLDFEARDQGGMRARVRLPLATL
jgi:two-component system sensor histidine kinase RegB